jgi:hypothetical protein
VDHRAEAEKYLRINAALENSAVAGDSLGAAEVHALLDVADAIREQTAVMTSDSVRFLAERSQ